MGTDFYFHKIGPIMIPKKNRLHGFYDIFIRMCKRRDD